MVIFHSYVSLPEGTTHYFLNLIPSSWYQGIGPIFSYSLVVFGTIWTQNLVQERQQILETVGLKQRLELVLDTGDVVFFGRKRYPLVWLFDIAMEHDPFIDGLPIKNGDFL